VVYFSQVHGIFITDLVIITQSPIGVIHRDVRISTCYDSHRSGIDTALLRGMFDTTNRKESNMEKIMGTIFVVLAACCVTGLTVLAVSLFVALLAH
jgi:hypothetical protein